MTKTKAMILLTCASTIVGSNLVVSRLIKEGTSIYTLQFFSMILASLLLYMWLGHEQVKREIKKVSRKDVFYLVFQAFTGVVLFRVLLVYGVRLTKAMDAGIILSFVPIATVIFSMIFLGERLGKVEYLAVAFSFIGVLIINVAGISGDGGQGTTRLLGNLLVMIATISQGAFAIFSKKVSEDLSPLMKSLLLCMSSVVLFGPFSGVELMHNHSFLMTKGFWLLTLYTGLVLTVVAYILWFTAITHVSATTVGVFNTLTPVSSIVLVALLFKEVMSVTQWIGLICVLCGVVGMIVSDKPQGEVLAVEHN